MNTSRMLCKNLVSAVVILAASGTMADSAQPDNYIKAAGSEAQSRVVRFADLDLTRDAGLDTLYLRLDSAARQVCGATRSDRNHFRSAKGKQCREAAVDRAVDAISYARLTQYHLTHTGHGGEYHQLVAKH